METKTKTCEKCGKIIDITSEHAWNKKYCPECAKLAANIRAKECMRRKRAAAKTGEHYHYVSLLEKENQKSIDDFHSDDIEIINVGGSCKDKLTLRCKHCGREWDYKTKNLRAYNPKCCSTKTIQIGEHIGMLTVLEKLDFDNRTNRYKCRCDCGNVIEVYANTLYSVKNGDAGYKGSCGCVVSKEAAHCLRWMQERNIDVRREFSFDDLKSEKGKPLRFDFAVFKDDKLVCLIEYQGRQHSEQFVDRYGGTYFGESTRKTDPIKKQYCEDHGLRLEEIWYDEDVDERMTEICEKYGV